MKRHALMLRYAPWQALDYFDPAGIATTIVVVLLSWPFTKQIEIMAAYARPGHTPGPPTPEMWQQGLYPLVYVVAFLGTMLATHGIISENRRLGYFRFLFAKPVSPIRYYAQAFVINGLGFLALAAALLSAYSLVVTPMWTRGFIPVVALIYVAFGGITFLISSLIRGDGLLMIVIVIFSNSAWTEWGASPGIKGWLTHALPPMQYLGDLGKFAIGFPITVPWSYVVWLGGYGLGCFVLGIVALRLRAIGDT